MQDLEAAGTFEDLTTLALGVDDIDRQLAPSAEYLAPGYGDHGLDQIDRRLSFPYSSFAA